VRKGKKQLFMASATKLGTMPAVWALSARLLSPKQASEFLAVPESTLAHWRSERRGPVYVKLEASIVRYRKSDLEKYIGARIVEPAET
jgi:predicted DNA-binding transcriptional regulator AlpA